MFEEYPDIVTVDMLKIMLAIGRNTAYKLVQTGQIKSLHLGKKYIIPKVCVVEFVKTNAESSSDLCYTEEEQQ